MSYVSQSRAAFAAASVGLFLSFVHVLDAAVPASGTLTRTTQQLTYKSDFYNAGNTTDPAGDGSTLQCNGTAAPCDNYTLTVDVPDNFATTNPTAKVHITIAWPNDTSDWDLYVLDSCGKYIAHSAARQTPASPEDPLTESVDIPAGHGKQTFTIRGVPYQPISTEFDATVTLVNGGTPPATPDPSGTPNTACNSGGGGGGGAGGTITPSNPKLPTHKAGPFAQANATPDPAGVNNGPTCDTADPCDSFALTVDLPSGYAAAHPHAAVKVTLSWTDTGSGSSDYDLYVFKGNPNVDGSVSADYKSAGGSNPESTSIFPVQDGSHLYTVKSVPYTPTGETISLDMELIPGGGDTNGGGNGNPGPCDATVFGGPDKPCAGNPRYQTFFAPHGTSAEAGSQGEYNVGYNPHSGRILSMNIGPIWRTTPAEVKPGGTIPYADSGLPESCPELWEDVSDPSTDTGLDPILITDPVSGRTFATNSTAGGASIYTDSDGGDPPANDAPSSAWLQAAQPPNGGADHETFAVGPLPASESALSTPVNKGQWLAYCSQDLAAPSMCQRSLTLGTSWDNPTPGTGVACSGLHGHAKIAPDGTAWLPVKSCGSTAGGSISNDTSITPWTEFTVQKTAADADGPAFTTTPQTQGADPSIGFDSDSTAYYCYVNNEANNTEGHVHVAVGQRNGTTIKWIRDVDVGTSHGIVNAAHTEAVGGSSGRAACGFIGTNVPGNYQAGDFPGVWYPFIATTYDQGRTWTLVNASPNDPDQFATGVWQQGGGGQDGDRNLLDFNEMTMDEKGRPLYGHSDGCVSVACIVNKTGNDKTAFMRISRQIGGKTLLASYDSKTDTTAAMVPKRPCLLDKAWKDSSHPDFVASSRDDTTAHLKWRTPDHGGAAIKNYDVYRSTNKTGPYTHLATTPDDKPSYEDTTAGNADADMYYKVTATNTAVGTASADSNILDLKITPPSLVENLCTLPGITELTDPVGTGGTAPAGSAGPGMDLLAFNLAQPYSADGIARLIFTIKTDAGQAVQPAGSSWFVAIKIPGPDPDVAGDTSAVHYRAVHMTWAGPTPTFESYTPSPNNGGGVDGRFVGAGTQKPAESTSSYATPFDKVTIIVKASDLGLKPGDVITGFTSAVTQTSSPAPGLPAATATIDEMPDGLAFTGPTYTVQSASFCSPNTAPVVDSFVAAPASGRAPLDVTFTAAAHDADTTAGDTIASYTFNFGDGSAPVTQAASTTQHTYTTAGSFIARLTVTDSRGLASINSATQAISATASARSSQENTVLGGGLPAASLALLGVLGALRRVRRRN